MSDTQHAHLSFLSHVVCATGSASGNPAVARVMDTWIKQTGYPVLIVEETTAAGGAAGQRTFKLSQERFLQGGGKAQEGAQVRLCLELLECV